MTSFTANMAVSSVASETSGENENTVEIHKQTFTLEILQIIKDAQQQHGLRHGDYQRYRSYCTRRIRRLRKALHFVQGTKHRFQPKKITPEMLSDIRFLYIPLILTERCWGYAMQLKQEANTELRKKFHLVSRLRKAVKHVEELEELCESPRCDARTKLETQAYSAWIKGSLEFELSKWQPAMENFRKAQTIYGKLGEALNEDERILYHQRVDELTPNIRYCAYNIGDESAMDDLVKMRLSGKGEDTLSANLDHLINQTREKQAATLSEVTWLGRTIPVRHEKVRVFLLSTQECEEQVANAPDQESKLSVYESLLLECKDALQLIRDELKTDPNYKNSRSGMASDGPISSLNFLHSYLIYIRLSKTIERNLLMIEALKQQLKGVSSKETSPAPNATESVNKKPTKPQDLIRPFEIIIQNLNEMIQLPGVDAGSPLVEEVQSEIIAYKAHRCFYLGLTYGAASKYIEALALYQRSGTYCKQALHSGNIKNKKLIEMVQNLEGMVESQKYSCHALSILGTQGPAEQMAALSIQEKKNLVDRLENFVLDQSLTTKQPKVAKFPPDFQPIPCKPLFFDLALNHVEFPSLDDLIEQKKGGGITGFVKGWLGGWK